MQLRYEQVKKEESDVMSSHGENKLKWSSSAIEKNLEVILFVILFVEAQ